MNLNQMCECASIDGGLLYINSLWAGTCDRKVQLCKQGQMCRLVLWCGTSGVVGMFKCANVCGRIVQARELMWFHRLRARFISVCSSHTRHNFIPSKVTGIQLETVAPELLKHLTFSITLLFVKLPFTWIGLGEWRLIGALTS